MNADKRSIPQWIEWQAELQRLLIAKDAAKLKAEKAQKQEGTK
jgi:hypothetical protein